MLCEVGAGSYDLQAGSAPVGPSWLCECKRERQAHTHTSLESSCWLMTDSASSEACLLASASALSILERSAEIISWAFLSASDTAFCSSDMACLFTSFTASSEAGIQNETKTDRKRQISPRRYLLHSLIPYWGHIRYLRVLSFWTDVHHPRFKTFRQKKSS